MAKFCSYCGNEVHEQAVVCVRCGCPIPQQPNTQNKSYVSLILGIIGIVFALLFAIIGHACCITGICLGIKERNRGQSSTGLVLCIVGEVLAVLNSLLGMILALGIFL